MEYFNTAEMQWITFMQILITLAFTAATASIDAKHYKKGEWVTNKRDRWLQRCFFIIGLSLASWPFVDAIFLAMMFSGLFDPMLNSMRGLDFYHTGDPNKPQKGWDGIMTRIKNSGALGKPLILLIRVLLFAAGIFGLIYF